MNQPLTHFNYSINIGGKLVSLDTPKVMAIVNATPDSFYSDSRVNTVDSALSMAEKHILEGADILDIGGQSTRPNSVKVDETEEANRVIPVIEAIHSTFPDTIISIDTFYASVAEKALKAGAHIINDVSGADADSNMLPFVKEAKAPYILTHSTAVYGERKKQENIITEVYADLFAKLRDLHFSGVTDVILDLGFGFGKTVEENYQLFRSLAHFQHLEAPILVGISRKSMIWKLLETTPDKTLSATSALHLKALESGANILRVHDPREAKEVITLYNQLNHDR